ncbi:MAG: hypothetical protein M3198_19500 [Actinomycetota bacterium]|nr:hypothetical protein [Actinomycetota bacterium]
MRAFDPLDVVTDPVEAGYYRSRDNAQADTRRFPDLVGWPVSLSDLVSIRDPNVAGRIIDRLDLPPLPPGAIA